MRKSIILTSAVASFVLAGCGETAEAPVEEDLVVEEAEAEPASVSADGGPSVGTYEVTTADGAVYTYVANEDGTYTSTGPDGATTTGTWRQDGPNRWCDTQEGEEEICYTESVDENGVYNSVNEADPEDSSTIVRVET